MEDNFMFNASEIIYNLKRKYIQLKVVAFKVQPS